MFLLLNDHLRRLILGLSVSKAVWTEVIFTGSTMSRVIHCRIKGSFARITFISIAGIIRELLKSTNFQKRVVLRTAYLNKLLGLVAFGTHIKTAGHAMA